MLKPFGQYFNDGPILDEEIHPELKKVLDSDTNPSLKLHHITKAIRTVIKSGTSTGLSDTTPMKGSSRAVFLPREPTSVKVDGEEGKMHTAVKVAFPGSLDKYNKSGKLLGEHQNLVEADHYAQQNHSTLRKNDDGSFSHNPNGVIPPVLDHHPDGHHIHVGQVGKLNAGEFRTLTKNKDFPKGISHEEFHDALKEHHAAAHGKPFYGNTSKERIEQVQNHPLVENFQHFIANTDNHPGDYAMRNLGTWKHPVTGQKQIVASDSGFSNDVAKHYQNARMEQNRQNRTYLGR